MNGDHAGRASEDDAAVGGGAPLPKYLQISDAMATAIELGEFTPGARLPRGEELAEQFGASVNTVVRAMRSLQERGMIRRVPGAGTFVNHQHQVRRVTYIGPESGAGMGMGVFGWVELAIRKRLQAARDDFQIVHWEDDGSPSIGHTLRGLIRQAGAGGTDGLILLPPEGGRAVNEPCIAELDGLRDSGVSTILLDRDLVDSPDRTRHDLVSIDNRHAGYMVGRHVLSRGARTILFAAQSEMPAVVAERLEGLRSSLIEATGSDAGLRVVAATPEAVSLALDEMTPDAMIGKDDFVAALLLRVAYERHLRVPDDVLVAGFDDTQFAESTVVPLTTFHQPVDDLANAVIHALERRLEDPQLEPRRVSISGRMTVRQSTGQPE